MGEFLDKGNKARFISESTFKRLGCTEIVPGDVLISRLPDPVGRSCLVPNLGSRMITAVDCTIVRFDETRLIPSFFVFLTTIPEYYSHLAQYLTGASRQRISRANLAQVEIPLPPLSTQRQVVAEIQAERAMVEANRKLAEIFEKKIQSKLAEIWGEETIDSIRADPKTGDKHG
jgi:type I restriction enzyme S subunit